MAYYFLWVLLYPFICAVSIKLGYFDIEFSGIMGIVYIAVGFSLYEKG